MPRRRTRLFFRGRHAGALVATLLLSAGCALDAPPGRATPAMSALRVGQAPYLIRPGDKLDIRFYKTPELNIEEVPVRHDGHISLDLLGDVRVAGLRPDEVSSHLVDAYATELDAPRVTVIVRDFGGFVYVGGEVGEPEAIAFIEGLTALQAIQDVGGFNDRASLQNVILIRRGESAYEGYRLYLQDALEGEDYVQNVALEPDDILFIPRKRISNLNLAVEQYVTKNLPIPYVPLPPL